MLINHSMLEPPPLPILQTLPYPHQQVFLRTNNRHICRWYNACFQTIKDPTGYAFVLFPGLCPCLPCVCLCCWTPFILKVLFLFENKNHDEVCGGVRTSSKSHLPGECNDKGSHSMPANLVTR